ncbi:MAG: hypothetical protein IKT08_06545 [Bacteroidales bacterium]|nr:hypothetical protein [Bacteroidales bacterium]
MKKYLIIVVLLCLAGSLRADFYRTRSNRYIADVAFSGNQILVLENRSHNSILSLLDLDGNKLSETEFQQFFEELYIDCFGDCLLINQDSCLQIYFDRQLKAVPLTTFSKQQFQEKVARFVLEFNGAYVLRSMVYDKHDYHVQEYHGQAQTYSYMLKNDPEKRTHPLCRFVNTEAVKLCQAHLNQIIAMYNHAVPIGANELRQGTWDGDLRSLNQTLNIHLQILWYRQNVAKEYHTAALRYKDLLQLIDLQGLKIVEVDKEFHTSDPRPLKVLYGASCFKNQFLTDEATGKTYGVFTKDGMNYLGLYNPTKGTVSMGQKACVDIYPRAFKVHGGYAYSVFFDREKTQGVLSRVKINE